MESWAVSEWLALVLFVGWALRLAYKFGRETGRDETLEQFMRDPKQAAKDAEAGRAAEGRFRRWARGRGR